MRRLATASLTLLAAVTLHSAPAHADGTYFSMGMGPGEVSDELGAYVRDTIHARFALGHRVGHIAVEGYIAPEGDTEIDAPYAYSALRLGVDARYVLPVSSGLQVYVRGGLSKVSATLSSYGDGRYAERDFEGRGLGGGAGVQLRGKVRALGFLYWPLFFVPAGPKVDAAIFIDHGVEFDRLHAVTGPERSIDARFTRLTIGFNVGADF
ncbi:MAG: outer membrane beta-barrel protein [Myxococcales bacterium]|nr:outer membrane beta-barrel protein [Myxococcales bacterium]